MKINFDSTGNKVISIPPIHTYKNPIEYKEWHKKTIWEINDIQEISDAGIVLIDNTEMGVVVFADPLKPNHIFMLSSKLDVTKFDKEEGYSLYSQFFFWTTSAGVNNVYIAPPEMVNEFGLIVCWKEKYYCFPTKVIFMGYIYKIEVTIFETLLIFDKGEEGEWRVVRSPDSLRFNQKIAPQLIELVIDQLDDL